MCEGSQTQTVTEGQPEPQTSSECLHVASDGAGVQDGSGACTEQCSTPGEAEQFPDAAEGDEGQSKDNVTYQQYACELYARTLFYPSLVYTMVRSRVQPNGYAWWNRVTDSLILGALPTSEEFMRSMKEAEGVRAVVTLNEPYEVMLTTEWYASCDIDHLMLPTTDYMFAPTEEKTRKGLDFMRKHVDQGDTVYVHCKAGRGRSTTLVLCYLIEYEGMTPEEARDFVREKRPQIRLASAQWNAVLQWYERVKGLQGPVEERQE